MVRAAIFLNQFVRIDELALLMTLEMGKPIADSKAEITYAAEFFRWYSEQAVRIDGRYAIAPDGSGRFLTMKQPVGPCLMITPWNFPMAMGTRKIGPAIAAGCDLTSIFPPRCTRKVRSEIFMTRTSGRPSIASAILWLCSEHGRLR